MQTDLEREITELRKENRLLREERDVLKKPQSIDRQVIGTTTERFLREPKTVRFRFVEENRGGVSTDRLCQIMDVSPRGFRAFRSRPMSQSQRTDMVLLAPIREQHKLSLGSYALHGR
jgi:hypothetical protein